MPVVQRQVIPKYHGPSGLDKFLSVLQTGASIYGTVQSVKASKASTDLSQKGQKYLEDQRDFERSQKQDEFTVNALTMQTKLGRDNMLKQQEQTGAKVDPALYGSAITLGDVPPERRTALRESLARLMNRKPEEIDNGFVLSEENLPAVINRVKSMETLKAIGGQIDNTNPQDVAAQQGWLKDLSGSSDTRSAGAITSGNLLDAMYQNELIRKDPTTGQLSGILINNPGQAMADARKRLGLEAPMQEYDMNGQRIFLTSATFEDIFKATIESGLIEGRTEKEANHNAALKLAGEARIPVELATRMLTTRDTTGLDPQYAVLAKNIFDAQDAAMAALAATKPFAAITAFAGIGKDMGIKPADMLDFVYSMAKKAHDSNPDTPIPPNPGWLQKFLGWGETYKWGQNGPPMGLANPADATRIGGTPMAPTMAMPNVTAKDFEGAMNTAVPGMVELALKMTPSTREMYLNNLTHMPMIGADGKPLVFDPAMVDYIRQQIKLRESTTK